MPTMVVPWDLVLENAGHILRQTDVVSLSFVNRDAHDAASDYMLHTGITIFRKEAVAYACCCHPKWKTKLRQLTVTGEGGNVLETVDPYPWYKMPNPHHLANLRSLEYLMLAHCVPVPWASIAVGCPKLTAVCLFFPFRMISRKAQQDSAEECLRHLGPQLTKLEIHGGGCVIEQPVGASLIGSRHPPPPPPEIIQCPKLELFVETNGAFPRPMEIVAPKLNHLERDDSSRVGVQCELLDIYVFTKAYFMSTMLPPPPESKYSKISLHASSYSRLQSFIKSLAGMVPKRTRRLDVDLTNWMCDGSVDLDWTFETPLETFEELEELEIRSWRVIPGVARMLKMTPRPLGAKCLKKRRLRFSTELSLGFCTAVFYEDEAYEERFAAAVEDVGLVVQLLQTGKKEWEWPE